MIERGKYITLDGPEGVGKTTQISRIRDYLEDRGDDVVLVREPGGTIIGQEIRSMLLDPDNTELDAYTELALYTADRSLLYRSIILPALETGQTVLSDRSYLATIAYQGYGGRVPVQAIVDATKVIVGEEYMNPDAAILLEYENSNEWIERVGFRGQDLDRMEQKTLEFHENVANGYKELAKRVGIFTVNASQSMDQVTSDITQILDEVLTDNTHAR